MRKMNKVWIPMNRQYHGRTFPVSLRRFLQLGITLVVSIFILFNTVMVNVHADSPDNKNSLRAAVEHLIKTYPDRYPHGPEFLKRLDLLEEQIKTANGNPDETQKLQAEFHSLQREALLANPLLTAHPIIFITRHQYRTDHHNTGTMFLATEVNAASFQGGGAIKAIDFSQGGKVETLLELPEGVVRDLEVHFDARKILFAMRRHRNENYHLFEMHLDHDETVPAPNPLAPSPATGDMQKNSVEKRYLAPFSLRQLTFKPDVTDIDPIYLPDGSIVFASTRDPKYCGCNQHIQANLFRMNADGSNLFQIGRNNLFESRPSLMPDGRILYDRWEYVDRHFGPSFGLWTTSPDGCNHALFYGNNAWSPGAIFDARVLPGTPYVIATFGACHDRPWGALAILDRREGMDGTEPLVQTWPSDIENYLLNHQQYNQGRDEIHPVVGQIDQFQNLPVKYEDPFPLDDHFFLCARMLGGSGQKNSEQTGIYLLDRFGNEILLHAEEADTELGCFDPMPLAPRERPPVIPDKIDFSQKTGTFYVADIYRGTDMKDVPRGTIKTIRVVEAPPKRYFTDPLWQMDTLQRPAMNYNCTNNKRILGDAPVEPDGSAYFEVPANRFVFFQALDAQGQMVQSMRSGTTLQPGEHIGCIGCHDRRYDSVDMSGKPVALAMKRPPSTLKPWHGPAREFNYLTEVQPVFNRHCVSCHDYGKEAEKALNLSGDLGLAFNTSYLELRKRSPIRWFPDPPGAPKQLVKAVDDGPPEVLPPYAWGSHRSHLIDLLRTDHYGVKLDPDSFDRIITWIDLNAPYYGSYASNYPENLFGRSPLDDQQLRRLTELTGIAVGTKTPGDPLQGTQVNFTRPELSPCLASFTNKSDARYREALAIIQAGKKTLYHRTRADMPDFTLFNPIDQQRYRKYLANQTESDAVHAAILKNEKRFEKECPKGDKETVRPLRFLRPVGVSAFSGPGFVLQGQPKESPSSKNAATNVSSNILDAGLAIDGDPATFACLLDDTLPGENPATIPPRAAAPVTGHILFDLGRPYLLTGIRLMPRQVDQPYNPKNIDIFYYTDDCPDNHATADDIENDPGIKPLIQNREIPPLKKEDVLPLYFTGVMARYIGLRVNDSYESGGGGKHYNFQLAEVDFIGREPPDDMTTGFTLPPLYQKQASLPETILAARKNYRDLVGNLQVDRDADNADFLPEANLREVTTGAVNDLWENLGRDFPAKTYPFLEKIHFDWFDSLHGWFANSDSTALEQRFVRPLLDRIESATVNSPQAVRAAAAGLRAKFDQLRKNMIDADDPRWLQLCIQTVRTADLVQDLDQLRQAVDELASAYPETYSSQKTVEQIDLLLQQTMTLGLAEHDPTDPAWDELSNEIATLKHRALVAENPLLKNKKILFAKRHAYCPGWYYADFNYATQFGGNLCILSLDSGEVQELVPELEGGIFDRFDLSFDATRIVFGYKKEKGHGFRLYEVGVDGTGLRQITTDPADEPQRIARYRHPAYGENGSYQHHTDDFHPCYLPDGNICFTSTRCERGVLCDQPDHLSVNTLYRVDRDGTNLQPLSEGALSESTPSITNDGRILYTRWEYVDKGVIAVQSLWAMRPDGSGSFEIFGGQHEFPPVLIHARAIPGQNQQFVSTCTMHHPFAVGPVSLIDTRRPLLTQQPLQSLTPDTSLCIDGPGGFPQGEQYTHWKNGRWVPDNCGPLFADPFPLADPTTGHSSGKFFLVICNPDRPWNDRNAYALYLIDTFGNRVPIYADPKISCWQPMPLEPRPIPPVLPSFIADRQYSEETNENTENHATIVLSNIYAGLDNVEPGTVKYLRIWEQVPRPWSARRFWPHDETQGQHAVISLNSHIYVKILHGIVPVDDDGSAHFTVPADKNLFFQALDKDFMEVQRMRTFIDFQPGEKRSCVGCHLTAHTAPANVSMTATTRPPVSPSPQLGETAPRPIHYVTDVQPIFDRHCVECHNEKQSDGQLDLSGTLTTYFNRSYEQIMTKDLVAHIQEFIGPQPDAQKRNTVSLPPYSLGSHASRLVEVLRQNHYDVKLSPEEWIKLITWVDANGPYYGSYFGRRNLMYRDHPDFRPIPTLSSPN